MGKYQQILSKIRSFLGSKIYPSWETILSVPEDGILYRNVHFSLIDTKKNKVSASAFKDLELSCDLNKYSTPQQTKELIGKQYKHPLHKKQFKNPDHFFVISLAVKDILSHGNGDEKIKHDPIQFFPVIKGNPNNRAHSIVIGNQEEKQRVKNRLIFSKLSRWEIYDELEATKLKSLSR